MSTHNSRPPFGLTLRVALRLALIAVLAAFAAPVAAQALQSAEPQRHHVHSNEPRIVREVERGGEEVAREAEHEQDAPLPVNFADFGNKRQPPYLAALVNFGLLAVLYYTLGKKPIAAALQNRRTNVVKEIEEAQRIKREAEARAKQYQAKLANLEEELAATRSALHEAGAAERDRIVKDAEEKAARMQKDATFLLNQELKQMRLDLQREAVEMAVTAAERLLQERVTTEDQERLGEEFLRSLESHPGGGA
jgi:F0F1-type ATP synthase membrane subunit b/b'